MPQPFTYEQFKEIYAKVPRLSVDLVVLGSKGVLLTKRDTVPFKGFWHIPGGTVYHGESLEKAVMRVASDEIGVTVKVGNLLGYIEYRSVTKQTPFDQPVALVFKAEIVDGEPSPASQGEAIEYFKELPENCIPEQAAFLRYNHLVK